VENARLELSTLREISQLLSGSSELPELVDKMVQAARKFGGGDACCVGVYADSHDVFECSAYHGLSQASADALNKHTESWVPSSFPESGEPVILHDPGKKDVFGKVASKEALKSAAVIPVMHDAKPAGLLALFWKTDGHPTAAERESLLLLAHQAGVAVENARIIGEARRHASALDAIFRVTQLIGASPRMGHALNLILDEACKLFGADRGSIRLINPETRTMDVRASRGLSKNTLKHMSREIGLGLSGWVAKQGVPLRTNDPWSDPRNSGQFPRDAEQAGTLMIAPLVVEGKTIGVLTVASDEHKNLTDEDETLLTTLANQAAVVIENARLYEQVKKRLAEQRVLYGIAQHLSSTLDVPTLLKFVINHLSAFFRANFATIRLLDESGTLLLTGATFGITDEYIRHANENVQMTLDPSTAQGQSPVAVAVREKRICAITNIAKDRRFTEWRKIAQMQSYTSMMCVPLIPTDTPIGVISLYFQQERRLAPEESELLQTAARASAIALQRAMLDERLLKEEVSRRALEEVSHLKTEFVSLVSHELRTPLTSIQGYIRLILGGHTGELNEVQQEFLSTAARNTDRLIALVDDLLDISRIESGRLELVMESLDLPEIITSEVESMRSQAEDKEVAIVTDIERSLPQVKADSHRLGQIISNLLTNAVKFSRAKTTVKITANQIGKNVLVKIIDSGIGIAPEDRHRLFERFYRGDSDAVRATWGTGLGLAITHHLVEMHGGKIWVESEKGHGSTFSFSIPAILPDA
jgi:signal transduction histidine kinase